MLQRVCGNKEEGRECGRMGGKKIGRKIGSQTRRVGQCSAGELSCRKQRA
jgi:hypothetical protein